MDHFYITNESTEDTFDSTDNMQDAIRIAKEAVVRIARALHNWQGAGPVCFQHNGKKIRQYVLMPDGEVVEMPLV